MKSGHSIRQDRPVVNATDDTSDALLCGTASAENVMTSVGTTIYEPGGGSVIVDPPITANGSGASPDATVEISGGFQSGEVLSGGGGNWDGSKGILTITDATDWINLQSNLRSVTFETTSRSSLDRTITVTVGDDLGSSLYYSGTDHYYEFVSAHDIDWTAAKPAAESKSYSGLNGYLATVSSSGENDFISSKLSGEGWMGASDANTENAWFWVTGPEAGTQFWQGVTNGNVVGGCYNNWASGEPNDHGADEDYAHFLSDGYWNDYAHTTSVDGYVVEYGGPGFGGNASESSAMDTKTITIATCACTDSGRHDGRGCEEGCAGVHSGICDRGSARSRLRDDAAQRVGQGEVLTS